MKNKSEVNFTMEQLKGFLEKYPVHGLKDANFINQDETNIYLIAFKYYIEHGEDIMADYYRIKDTVADCFNMGTYRSYFIYDDSSDKVLQKIIQDINFVINYTGIWNVDALLNSLNCSKEKLIQCLHEVENNFPKYHEDKILEREKELENYIEKYYEVKRNLTNEDLDLFFAKTIAQEMSSNIDKNVVDVTNIKYPILVFLYKGNKIISINKVIKNLEAALVNHKKNKNFDSYTYIYVNEDVIDDILVESFVRYNPVQMLSNAITVKNSIYRTLGQIKQRYKNNKRVDLRVIKNIISIYEIPMYNLMNGQQIVDKDLFDEALDKYLNGR